MKLLFLLLLVTCLSARAQMVGSTFYGNKPERYKGKTLKVISTPDPYMYYMLDKSKYWSEPGNVYLPSDRVGSDPGQLFGKEFLVADVTPADHGNSILEMKEVTSGDLVYYYYSPSAGQSFTMHVVGEEAVEETEVIDLCANINDEVDKFTGVRTVSSPYESRYNIRVDRSVTKAKAESYTLYLYTTSNSLELDNSGVVLLLTNGTKIARPNAKVAVEPRQYDTHGTKSYEYSASIRLSAAERMQLLRYRITDFRLEVFDQAITESDGRKFQEYLRCVTQKK